MTLDRRSVLVGGIVATAAFSGRSLVAQTPSPSPPDGMEQLDPLPPEFNGGLFLTPDVNVNFGSAPPPAVYAALAAAVLRGAPFNCRPIDVAYYFSNVREKRLTPAVLAEAAAIASQVNRTDLASPQFLSIFAYDWERSRYYNPVVIGIFRGVGLQPYAGDQTPWCAAFANWCISRSRATSAAETTFSAQRRAIGTRNASSGSFRCWGTDDTADPREGDVIVWAKVGTVTGRCPNLGQGHVAFVSSVVNGPDGKRRFRVVGGNQGFTGSPGGDGEIRRGDVAQAVSYRTIGTTFGDRALHSVRTLSFLR